MTKVKLWHTGIWFSIFVINLALMTRGEIREGALFELFFVMLYSAVFYINTLFLFPEYYETSKFRYWLYGILVIALTLLLVEIIRELVFGSHHHRRNDMIETLLTFRQALWIILVFIIGTLLSIQEQLTRQIINKEKLLEEKLQTELQLLKAQINPHFLFNALNNIYSLAYMKSDRAPESVLKLSEMLRYVTDDCSKDKVSLQGEIDYIRNYIDFNKMKYPGERNITFKFPDTFSDILIAPMIFIPLIENCFKYSRIEEDTSGFISISITEIDSKVIFNARNSIFADRPILKGSGKGIDNVKQRLEIIYPGKNKLATHGQENTYSIELQIDVT